MDQPIQFGPYLLLERISLGGMAEVFKAVEFGVEGFKRTVAVKRILPHVAEDDEFISMFKDEANIAVQLTHSNIAQIYKLGEEQDGFYIALEYVQGKDLRTIFERNRRSNELLPVPQACFMVMQVCEGLDYAHNKKDAYGRALNIIHRDVSPPNVLVSFEGEVKLCDFGVAKAAGRVSKTQAGILKGKFGYMSPEQVKGQALDRRSDVFSLGVVLWEILTNQRLFQGEDDLATLKRLQAVEVPSARSFNPQIPVELEKVIYKALTAEPNDRYQSASEFHDDLQAFMFAQGLFFSRKDLQAWMRRVYARDIELEKEKASKQQALAPGGVVGAGALAAAGGDAGPRRSTQIGMAAPPAPPGAPSRRPPPPPPGAASGKAQTAAYKAVGTPPVSPGASGSGGAGGAADESGRKRAKTILATGMKVDIPVPGRAAPTPEAPRPRAITPPAPVPAAPAPLAAAPASGGGRGSDFDWDDEELETRIHDGGKIGEDDLATVGLPRGAAPSSGSAVDPAPGATAVGAADAASSLRASAGQGRSIPSAPRPRSLTPAATPATVSMTGGAAPRAAAVSMTPSAGIPVVGAVTSLPGADVAPRAQPARSNNVMLFGVVGLVALAAVAVVVVLMMRPQATPAAASTPPVVAGAGAGAAAVPVAATGTLSLDLTPADAKVEVDGNEVAGTGSPREIRDLSAGTHKLVVSSGDAYLPYSQDITITEGGASSVTVKLPVKQVTLDITVEPAVATLALLASDAKDKPVAIQAKHTLTRAAGVDYEVQASLAGYKTQSVPVAFGGGSTDALKITLVADVTAAGTGPTVAAVTPPTPAPTPDPAPAADPAPSNTGGPKKAPSGGKGSSASKSGGGSGGGGGTTKAKTAELKIGTAPGLPPAEVFVDGKSVGKTVVKVMVTPGSHSVKWKWADGASSSEKVSIGDGESKTLKGSK